MKKQNKKDKKQEQIEKIVKDLRKVNISGILYFPGFGVVSFIETLPSLLSVIDEAKTLELERETKREVEVKKSVMIKNNKNEDATYVG
jgi:hypothetical protein